MLILCVPGLFAYNALAAHGAAYNVIFMFIVGVLVNGPYTLISSAVAADLGQHPSLKGNPKVNRKHSNYDCFISGQFVDPVLFVAVFCLFSRQCLL